MISCPECGKRHPPKWRPGNALAHCEATSQFDLGHYTILGLPADDPRLTAARQRTLAFQHYLETLTQ